MLLLSLKRHVHINTGTHGMEDGSTIFWQSEETKDWLNPTSLEGMCEEEKELNFGNYK